MDADDEWWGESAIVPVIQALAASGPTEISIDALLTLLPSYLPRLAVDLWCCATCTTTRTCRARCTACTTIPYRDRAR